MSFFSQPKLSPKRRVDDSESIAQPQPTHSAALLDETMASPPKLMSLRSSTTELVSDFQPSDVIETKTFSWEIPDWNRLAAEPARSPPEPFLGPVETVGSCNWQLLLFPRGNDRSDYVAVYLKYCGRADEKQAYTACASFKISLSIGSTVLTLQDSHFRFSQDANDWGFSCFVKIQEIEEQLKLGEPLITLDTRVSLIKDSSGTLWADFSRWNSRKETGYVGIRNQGATCYMNSLLQSLFFTTCFRRAVFALPSNPGEESLILALQRVFYQLQLTTDSFVDTQELTKSFGWGLSESVEHHDVQEFLKKLQDSMERKLKEANIKEDPFEETFSGKLNSVIRCINVPYTSKSVETFHEILLPIHSHSMQQALADYTTFEKIEGENALWVDGHGKQDILKGVLFKTLPPVLHFQLLRFVFDFDREATVKLNDRFEFPTTIDMRPYMDPDVSEDLSINFLYHLHGVLVHCGESNVGHYYAFLRPTADGSWFKFDDERVTPATEADAVAENYGCDPQPYEPQQRLGGGRGRFVRRLTNAYMLVYIRESAYEQVLLPGKENELIPDALAECFSRENRDRAMKEEQWLEEMNTIKVKIVDPDRFSAHHGTSFCQLANSREGESYSLLRLPKDCTPRQLISKIQMPEAAAEGLLWEIASSRNSRYALREGPVTGDDLDLRLGREFSLSAEKKFFFFPHQMAPGSTLAFVKVFYSNEYESRLEGLCCIGLCESLTLDEGYLKSLRHRVTQKYPQFSGASLRFWHERSEEIAPLDTSLTVRDLGLSFHGSLIVIEVAHEHALSSQGDFYQLGNLAEYFQFLINRKVYRFVPVDQNAFESFTVEFSCFSEYPRVYSVAEKLIKPPAGAKIRLLRETGYDDLEPLRSSSFVNLATSVNILNENFDSLCIFVEFVQVDGASDMQPNFHDLKSISIISPSGEVQRHTVNLFLDPDAPLSQLTDRLVSAKLFDRRDHSQLCFGSVSQNLFDRVFFEGDLISSICEISTLYATECSPDYQSRIPGFHFHKLLGNTHSNPFISNLPLSITLLEAREVLCERFKIPEKKRDAVRIHFLASSTSAVALTFPAEDGDSLGNKTIGQLLADNDLDTLAIDHPQPKFSYQQQRSMTIK